MAWLWCSGTSMQKVSGDNVCHAGRLGSRAETLQCRQTRRTWRKTSRGSRLNTIKRTSLLSSSCSALSDSSALHTIPVLLISMLYSLILPSLVGLSDLPQLEVAPLADLHGQDTSASFSLPDSHLSSKDLSPSSATRTTLFHLATTSHTLHALWVYRSRYERTEACTLPLLLPSPLPPSPSPLPPPSLR
mmetsp:Transcript_29880/g.95702  ORF Transcript_29880/g.95702 Transcript_29880/m.95702 type:complete len:189 (-) Transcript_29880:596-1162(-)